MIPLVFLTVAALISFSHSRKLDMSSLAFNGKRVTQRASVCLPLCLSYTCTFFFICSSPTRSIRKSIVLNQFMRRLEVLAHLLGFIDSILADAPFFFFFFETFARATFAVRSIRGVCV